MKNLLFIIAFIPVIGFSQTPVYEVKRSDVKKKMNQWYKACRKDSITTESKRVFFKYIYQDDYIQSLDFVLSPDIYNSNNDSNIVSIEFIQDNDHIYQDSEYLKATITSFDSNYSIGRIKDYMIDPEYMGFSIKKTYKDNTIKTIYIKMHFNYALLSNWSGFSESVAIKPIDIDEFQDYDY